MLEKIEDNLKDAYENLGWEDRKILLDNLNNSLDKSEISPEEFEKSAMYLRKTCPGEDANNWHIYWLEDKVKFTEILMNEFVKAKILVCFHKCMTIEMYFNFMTFVQEMPYKNECEELDIIGDTLFHSMEDYKIIKEELCRYLRYYGLTPQQEQEIMQGESLLDKMDLICTLLKSNKPKFEPKS